MLFLTIKLPIQRKAKPMSTNCVVSTSFLSLPRAPEKPHVVFPFFWVHPSSGVIRRRSHPFGTMDNIATMDIIVHVPDPTKTTLCSLFYHDHGSTSDCEAWNNRVRDGNLTINIHQD